MSAYYGLGDYQQRREENLRQKEAAERARTLGAIAVVLVILLVAALGFGGMVYRNHKALFSGESELNRSSGQQLASPVTQSVYRSADNRKVNP